MSVVLEYSCRHTVSAIIVVLGIIGKFGECHTGIVGHGQRRALRAGQQPPVLGWDVDGRLFESVTSINVNSPAGGAVHPFIAPVPVRASVGTVHAGRGLRSKQHRDETVEETGCEGDDCHGDDLLTEVVGLIKLRFEISSVCRLSLSVLAGITLKQAGDKLSQSREILNWCRQEEYKPAEWLR